VSPRIESTREVQAELGCLEAGLISLQRAYIQATSQVLEFAYEDHNLQPATGTLGHSLFVGHEA
jgi:hypothetical protein